MCGIFGYYQYNVDRDRKAILEFLFNGLRRLEYRGYDSAGISIDTLPLPANVSAYGLLVLVCYGLLSIRPLSPCLRARRSS